MAELLAPKEILQARTDQIITSLNLAEEEGLDKETVHFLELTNYQQHRDYWMVHLGLKPSAVQLPVIFQIYYPFFDHFKTDVPVKYSHTVPSVWNSQQISRLLNEHVNLLKDVLQNDADAQVKFKQIPLRDDALGEFLNQISGPYIYEGSTHLSGILNGFPPRAAQRFARYYRSIDIPINEYLSNFEVNRDHLLKVCQENGITYSGLIDYFSHLREAQVPGSGYVISADDITEAEENLMASYQASGFEEKLAQFLAAN